MKILIMNGRVLDPANNFDAQANIFVDSGKIVSVKTGAVGDYAKTADEIIDAAGLWVVPGLIDMHVHLRDPGQLHKETIATGTRAAAAGGFCTVCCMPNTSPVIHSAEVVNYIREQAAWDGAVRVLVVGSITKDLAGVELSALEDMKEAGIVAISDDGKTVENVELFTRGLVLAQRLNLPVLSHCEPEEEIIARDIELARETGARLHICHVSTAVGVELIREAQKSGQNVTAEVAPHHFVLVADDIPLRENAEAINLPVDGHTNLATNLPMDNHANLDTNYKMAPPLRSVDDRVAILDALKDGTISAIATDHAPHHATEKALPYESAANGIIGLETAVPLAITELVNTNILTPLELIAKFTVNPAKILNLPHLGSLAVGGVADITLIDPIARYIIDRENFQGLSKNTPFHGRAVTGRVVQIICNGKIHQ